MHVSKEKHLHSVIDLENRKALLRKHRAKYAHDPSVMAQVYMTQCLASHVHRRTCVKTLYAIIFGEGKWAK